MSSWGAGYVTDIAYTTGYYPFQAPSHLKLAALLNGIDTEIDERDEGLSYLEIGCGFGLTALVLAASNPSWQVTGIDFNPAHIAAARRMAVSAGLSNVSFIEADLTTLASSPRAAEIPEADVISSHGVWSWVGQAVRDGIVALLRDKLRSGGIAHLSYNCLPAWQEALGLQRLLRTSGEALAGRSDRQALAGLEVVQLLAAAEATHLQSSKLAKEMVERMARMPPAYLAHEYMNADWSPCFHADVVTALAPAKLEWVGSANLWENFPTLVLNEMQLALMNRFDDPVLRELVKDTCSPRILRSDVFMRGATRLSVEERDAALSEMFLSLTVQPARFRYEMEVPAGHGSMNPDFYKPIVEALAEGPRRVKDLLALATIDGRRKNPTELVGMLVGTQQAIVVPHPDRSQSDAAIRFNREIARRLGQFDRVVGGALASSQLGAGLPANNAALYVWQQLMDDSPVSNIIAWSEDPATISSPEERTKLSEVIRREVASEPLWRSLRLLDM